MLSVYVLSIALIGSLTSVSGLQCNEGFNASISGIPLYHWVENTCNGKSKCFSQELEASMGKFDVTMRYGGCVSSVYAPYLTCDNLFGKNSKLDPAMLLNLIPDLDQKFKLMATSFSNDALNQFHQLLSSGKGSEEFISGVIQFGENLGFNMRKVKKLQKPMARCFELLFIGKHPHSNYQMQMSVADLLRALEALDTDNEASTANVYKFMSNYLPAEDIEMVKVTEPYSTLIKKFPGLVKSTFPRQWRSYLWFDVLFEMLGEIQVDDPKQSTIDIIATLKAQYEPYTYLPNMDDYMGPIYDSLPDLVEQLVAGNGSYAGYWSVQLLKAYSVSNNATENLHNSFVYFLEGVGVQYEEKVPSDVKELIEWLPGFFYRLFPGRKEDISETYQIMADGFNSFNFNDWTDIEPATELSKFITMMAGKLMPFGTGPKFTMYVNNFSKMFYNLLSDETVKLDIFFQTLSEGFKNFPEFDTGKIITELITKYGGDIPVALQPFLLNMKGVVDSFMNQPIDTDDIFSSVTKMIQAYKSTFPDSEFPDLFQRYVNLIKGALDGTITGLEASEKSNELSIDFSFAFFNAFDFKSDELLQAIEEAFPVYGVYVRLMRALDPEDIKELYRSFAKWMLDGMISRKLSSQGFVDAIKPTAEKITAKLGDVTGQLRQLFKPNSCEYKSCEDDLCNGPKIQKPVFILKKLGDIVRDFGKDEKQRRE